MKTIPFWLKVERATLHTYCPDGKSFSFTTAQFVNDSSSVGHLAACIDYEKEREGGKKKVNINTVFFSFTKASIKASVNP